MDINSFSDLLNKRLPSGDTGDLLARLKTAGTIEAEVISLLQGKLLLSSRLGEILTSNSLHYKPGDRLRIQWSGSEHSPVLKASRASTRPLLLESAQHPQLQKALPPGQPVVAVIQRISTAIVEIRLARQRLQIAAEIAPERGGLLSLTRDDARGHIEIRPLDPRPIYKAILTQLVPRQTAVPQESLVKLLQLIEQARAAVKPLAARAIPRVAQNPIPRAENSLPARATPRAGILAANRPTEAAKSALQPVSPKPAPAFEGKQVNPAPALRPSIPSVPSAPSQPLPASRPSPAPMPAAVAPAAIAAATPWTRPDQQVTAPVDSAVTTAPNPKPAAVTANTAQTIAAPTAPPAPSKSGTVRGEVREMSNPGAEILKPAIPPTDRGGTPLPVTESRIGRAGSMLPHAPREPVPVQAAPGVNPATPPPIARVAAPASTAAAVAASPSLERLLQALPELARIDAPRLRSWFEILGLVRASISDRAAPAVRQILEPLLERDTFSRELLQAVQLQKGSGARENASTRTQMDDLLLPYIKDGIKLIEQTLSQSLLQRATLGLQQDTQQPLNLSFALPLIDEQQVKPLHIELRQRESSQQENEKSWDIRLNFEFSGLGEISCQVFLQGYSVAVSFYCQLDQTRERLAQALPQLRQQLVRAGFSPGELHSFPGREQRRDSSSGLRLSEALIDIEV